MSDARFEGTGDWSRDSRRIQVKSTDGEATARRRRAAPAALQALIRRRRIVPLVTVASLAVSMTACGSSGPSTPRASVSKADITTAYETLFNFSSSNLSAMTGVIQGGSALKKSMSDAIKSPLASAAKGAKVLSVTLESSSLCSSKGVPTPCASVKYDILGSGNSVTLGPETGYATYASGSWLVAKVTICSLLGDFYAASGNAGTPSGCPKPS